MGYSIGLINLMPSSIPHLCKLEVSKGQTLSFISFDCRRFGSQNCSGFFENSLDLLLKLSYWCSDPFSFEFPGLIQRVAYIPYHSSSHDFVMDLLKFMSSNLPLIRFFNTLLQNSFSSFHYLSLELNHWKTMLNRLVCISQQDIYTHFVDSL